MIQLSGKISSVCDLTFEGNKILRVSTNPLRPKSLRKKEVFLSQDGVIPEGFIAVLAFDDCKEIHNNEDILFLGEDYKYLEDGDVIKIASQSKKFRVLHRINQRYNSFLITERCNHYCLMCSQPPRKIEDGVLYDETIEVLKLCDRGAGEICFSGGEPTTEPDNFIKLLNTAKSYLPETSIHVLTNGRSSANKEFAVAIADINHADLMMGIPLYSSDAYIHDHVVQASGAFNETIKGIVNLNRNNIPVEIRVVLHALTIPTLEMLAHFISRSLPFVSQVAFMGLEITGFTRANLDQLWIDPEEYQDELLKAVQIIENVGIKAKIYNLPLCITNPELWENTVQSISDWKNEYISECQNCDVRTECGGFFSSAVHKMPKNIKAIKA
jgi:His-Xaa-Ser system radical SAM maturase HxsC